MTIMTRTSPKIFPGESKVMRRVSPRGVTPIKGIPKIGERPEPERREIRFIEKAKSPPKMPVSKTFEERLATRPKSIGDIVLMVQNAGLKGGAAVSSIDYYVKQANRRRSADWRYRQAYGEIKLDDMKAEQRSWYDKQATLMKQQVADAATKYDAWRAKQVEKGRPERLADYHALKAQMSIYPKWSEEYESASKSYGSHKKKKHRKQAKAKADRMEQILSGDISAGELTGTDIDRLIRQTIPREERIAFKGTQEEYRKWAKGEAIKRAGIRATAGEVATMGVSEGKAFAITPETKEEPAEVIPATDKELQTIKDAKAKGLCVGAMKAYYTIKTYTVTTRDGDKILVEALDEKTARQKAEDAGHKVAWVGRKVTKDTVPPKKTPTGAYTVTMEDGTKVTMVPFVDTETKQTLLIPKDAAESLKDTDAYKEAKGTVEQRLGIALTAVRSEFEDWVKQIKEEHPDLFKIYERQGYEGLNKALDRLTNEQKELLARLKNYERDKKYRLYDALVEGAITEDQAKELFGTEAVEGLTGSIKEYKEIEAAFEKLPTKKQDQYVREWSSIHGTGTPLTSYKMLTPEQRHSMLENYYNPTRPEFIQKHAAVAGKILLGFVPIAGTIAYWNDMGPGWRAASVAMDVLCIAAIARAAAAGARAARGYTAIARTKAGLAGAGEMIMAEITAPAHILAHPIATGKGIGRQIQSIVETLAHPRKIPLGSAELAYTTTRLPVEDVGGAAKAMKLRDAAVDAAIHGKKATATVGDVTLTLKPSELQKVGGAIAVHATPDVRPYMNGAVIKGGAEGSGVFMSPNFHSRFAQATAFGDMPEGGIKGGLIIRDKNVLNAIAPSGKTYRGAAEIEALLKPGTTLPAPSQVLVTRDAAGYRLTLLVIGEPFSQSQIAKLKVLGSMDTIGQVFKPTMTLTGAERTAISSMDDIISLSKERAILAQQLTTARAGGRTAQAQTLSQRITDIDQKIASLTNRVNVPREVIRPTDIVWAEYTDKGILERWQELNPRTARTTRAGTRLPEIRAGTAIRRAALARAERRVPLAGRRIPARGRREPPEGRRVPPGRRQYSPVRIPRYKVPYVPAYAPAHAPPYAPLKPPAYAPPYVAPGRPPLRPFFKGPPLIPKVKTPPIKLGREKLKLPKPSLVSWRQGMYFVTIVEPFRTTGGKADVTYSRHRPPHAKVVTGRRSPQRSLTTIGRLPSEIKLGMGVVKARVKHGRLGFQRGVIRGRRR